MLPKILSVARDRDYTDEAEEKQEGQGNIKLQMRKVLQQNAFLQTSPSAYLSAHRLGLFYQHTNSIQAKGSACVFICSTA